MGTWGTKSFDNDTAGDWGGTLSTMSDFSLIENTLDQVLAIGDNYLAAPEAERGAAACEVIARLLDGQGIKNADTSDIDKWIKRMHRKPSSDLVIRALNVLERIQAPNSELNQLWSDAPGFSEWRFEIDHLKKRLLRESSRRERASV